MAANKRRTTIKTMGKTDITAPISTKSTFLSNNNSGIASVSPPDMKKFRNVIASILFNAIQPVESRLIHYFQISLFINTSKIPKLLFNTILDQ